MISSRSDGMPYTYQCMEPDEPASSPLVTAQSSLTWMSGTSMATPLLAGSATLVRQYYRDGYYPSAWPRPRTRRARRGMQKATLIQLSDDLWNHATTVRTATTRCTLFNLSKAESMNQQGWGRLRLDTVLKQANSRFELHALEGRLPPNRRQNATEQPPRRAAATAATTRACMPVMAIAMMAGQEQSLQRVPATQTVRTVVLAGSAACDVLECVQTSMITRATMAARG